MKTLTIRNFGPIANCEIDVKNINVIIGRQSSGKSTIAKCLYYFIVLKDELDNLTYESHHPGIMADGKGVSLYDKFRNRMKSLFLETFGFDTSMLKPDMCICMRYSDYLYIQVRYNGRDLMFSYANSLNVFVEKLENRVYDSTDSNIRTAVKNEINDFFNMDYSAVFIPAGRTIMTTIGTQFSLFYSMLNDTNKRLIDLCTRNYVETVMRIKPLFQNGLKSLLGYGYNESVIQKAQSFINKVINGDYHFADGKEYLLLADGTKVDINYASSGQQESLWIFNILLYYSVLGEKKFYIIEEPESNLFPESQMEITQFIGLIANEESPVFINTHSPYVLGELNNMIYAGSFKGEKQKKASEIIPMECQVQYSNVQSFFIENGELTSTMDNEIEQIDNLKLDGVSTVINDQYTRLLTIEQE